MVRPATPRALDWRSARRWWRRMVVTSPSMVPPSGAPVSPSRSRCTMDEHSPLILVVDDERAILRALTAGLAAHDYRTSTAATGAEALARTVDDHPSVIL